MILLSQCFKLRLDSGGWRGVGGSESCGRSRRGVQLSLKLSRKRFVLLQLSCSLLIGLQCERASAIISIISIVIVVGIFARCDAFDTGRHTGIRGGVRVMIAIELALERLRQKFDRRRERQQREGPVRRSV